MGGSIIEDDWDDFPSNGARTVLLVGRVGNGKSATGNSLLGRKAFKSRASFAGVTNTTEMQSTMLNDGQVINVIDTIGLFDSSLESDVIGKEIVKCIDLAKDGIHAIILVLSVKIRFTKEESTTLQVLQTFFGPKVTDYMIVVFTGGDELEENDETLDDYLSHGCPELLQKLRQQEKDDVDSMQGHTKQEISDLKEKMYRSHEEQLKRITEMVESKLKETTKRLEEKLAEEHAARLKAEEKAHADQGKSNDEIRKLRESLEKAQRETEELRKAAEHGKCAIL